MRRPEHPALLNFIAIEPVVMGWESRFGRVEFSELVLALRPATGTGLTGH
jgi:hypothetical protein